MAKPVRLRLDFDPPPRNIPRRCCFLLDPKRCRVVADLCHVISKDFELHSRTTSLSLGEYSLLPGDDVQILRDDDIVLVKYDPAILATSGLGLGEQKASGGDDTVRQTSSKKKKKTLKRSASHQAVKASQTSKRKKLQRSSPSSSSSSSESDDSDSDSSSTTDSSSSSSSSSRPVAKTKTTTAVAPKPAAAAKPSKNRPAASSAKPSAKTTSATEAKSPNGHLPGKPGQPTGKPAGQSRKKQKEARQEERRVQAGAAAAGVSDSTKQRSLLPPSADLPKVATKSSKGNHIVFDSDSGSDDAHAPAAKRSSSAVMTSGSSSSAAATADNYSRQLCTVPPVQHDRGQTSPSFAGGRGRGRGLEQDRSSSSDFRSMQAWNGSQHGATSNSFTGRGRGKQQQQQQRGRGRGRGAVVGGPRDVLSYSNRVLDQSDEMQSLAAAAVAWTAALRNRTGQHTASSPVLPTAGTASTPPPAPRPSPATANASTARPSNAMSLTPQSGTSLASGAVSQSPSSARSASGGAGFGQPAGSSSHMSNARNPNPATSTRAPPPLPSSQSAELRKYSDYAVLKGRPSTADVIAFKVLELSSDYTPEISAFKEGTVLSVDTEEGCMRVKLRPECVPPAPADDAEPGKFELVYSDSDNEDGQEQSSQRPAIPRDEVEIQLSDVLEVRVITPAA